MVNHETRLHPAEFERYMKRLDPWVKRTARDLAGMNKAKKDDLLQEAAFALWQLDTSRLGKKGMLKKLMKVAMRAMTR